MVKTTLIHLLGLFWLFKSLVYSQEFIISDCTPDEQVEFIYHDINTNFDNAALQCVEKFGPSASLAVLKSAKLSNFAIDFVQSISGEIIIDEHWIGLRRESDDELEAQGIIFFEDPTLFTFEDGTPVSGFAQINGESPWRSARPNSAARNQACVM